MHDALGIVQQGHRDVDAMQVGDVGFGDDDLAVPLPARELDVFFVSPTAGQVGPDAELGELVGRDPARERFLLDVGRRDRRSDSAGVFTAIMPSATITSATITSMQREAARGYAHLAPH